MVLLKRTIDADDGAQLAVWCSANDQKPPMVLVHGMPLDHTMWNKLLDADGLTDNYYVIAPDLRGCGDSKHHNDNDNDPGIGEFPGVPPVQLLQAQLLQAISQLYPKSYERWAKYLVVPLHNPPQMYTYEQWAKDLNTIIRDRDHKIITDRNRSLQDIHLVGFSMGGAVVMQYMSDDTLDSSRVQQLTLISAAGPNMGPTMQKACDFPLKERLEALCAGLYAFAVLTWADAPDAFDALVELIFPYIDCEPIVDGKNETRDWIEQAYLSVHKDAKIGACLEMQLDHPDLANNVKKIKTPTKIIHGCSDPFVPRALGQDTQRRIPGTNELSAADRFLSIPYAGHGIFFTQSAELVKQLNWHPS